MKKFNPASSNDLSCLFFGGLIACEETIQEGYYKNGKPKTKKTTVLKPFKGLGIQPRKEWKTPTGKISVNETTLQVIASNDLVESHAAKIAQLMLEIRSINKEISTYYTSVAELIYPDGYVHAQFNHTATSTGRLSCKSPNIQNSPASKDTKVPYHFTSRYTDGVICSADYSGLEVRIEAQLSGDSEYIKDIINGVDFHCKNLALKEGIEYETVCEAITKGDTSYISKRKAIKGFTFAQQYGAGNKKIAEQTGFTEEEVQHIREARKEAYPRLHQYYEELKATVLARGQYQDPWGRVYKFVKYPPRFGWQKFDSYSPTEIQNWRTQGYATSSIVLSMLGIFWRTKALLNRHIPCPDCAGEGIRRTNFGNYPTIQCKLCEGQGRYTKYLLINTIHDSVMLDCRKESLEDAKKDLKVMEEVSIISNREFNYEMVVSIEINISSGQSWGDLE